MHFEQGKTGSGSAEKKVGILVLEGHLLRLVDQSHLKSVEAQPSRARLAFVSPQVVKEWCTIL